MEETIRDNANLLFPIPIPYSLKKLIIYSLFFRIEELLHHILLAISADSDALVCTVNALASDVVAYLYFVVSIDVADTCRVSNAESGGLEDVASRELAECEEVMVT